MWPALLRKDEIVSVTPRRGSRFDIKTSRGQLVWVPLNAFKDGLREKLSELDPREGA